MSQCDPLGFMAHFMITAKLMLRELYGRGSELGWDDPLTEGQQRRWSRFIREAVSAPPVRIPRSLVPERRGELWVVGFWDASLDAQAVVLYSRVQELDSAGKEKQVRTDLMFAKTRVAPLDGTTIAKMELQALVQLTRSALKLTHAMDDKVDRMILIGDSQCSVMAIRRPGVSYKAYFQNRVAEIRQNLGMLERKVGKLEEVAKIPGSINPADVGTRVGVKADELTADSLWLRGPHFLSTPRSEWPVEVPESDPDAVPQSEFRKGVTWQQVYASDVQTPRMGELLDCILNRFSSLYMVKTVLARVIRDVMCGKAGHKPSVSLRACDLEAAWKLLLHHEQSAVRQKVIQGKLSGIPVWVSGDKRNFRGLLVTRGRIPSQAWERLSGIPFLPVLLGSSRLALLLVQSLHAEDHRKEGGGLFDVS